MKKRIFKWAAGILLAPVILFFILAALLYIPPIQNFVVQKTTTILSNATGMDVRIGHLRLSFLFDLDLRDVKVTDAQHDELMDIGRLTVDLNFESLLHGEINVEGIELQQTAVNTKDLIPGVTIKGSIGRFFVDSHGIELPQENVTVNNIQLADADVDITLGYSDTPEDTTTSAVNWKIALHRTDLERIRLRLSMPGDSMRIAAGIQSAALRNGLVDLGTATYTAETFSLTADSLHYDVPHEQRVEGVDANHIALTEVELDIDSVYFNSDATALSLALRRMAMKERSGLEVRELAGGFRMDSTSLQAPGLVLRTGDSYVNLRADMDFAAMATPAAGRFSVRLAGELGKQDVLFFAGNLPSAFAQAYPNAPITLRVAADGNLDTLDIHTLEARLAGAFELKAKGQTTHITDSTRMGSNLELELQTRNLDFVKALAGGETADRMNLPPMTLKGTTRLKGQQYEADILLKGGDGTARLHAAFDAARTAYRAQAEVNGLQMRHFLPKDSLGLLSFTATTQGQGTDPFRHSTRMKAGFTLHALHYADWDFGGLRLSARLENGKGEASIDSRNPLLEMTSHAKALLGRNHVGLDFDLDLHSLDLYALRLTSKPFKAGTRLQIDGSTNLKNRHDVHGSLSNIALILQDTTFHPKDLSMKLLAHPDSTYANISAGDFVLGLDGREGYENLLKKSQEFLAMADRQLQRRFLNQDSLKLFLPSMRLNVSSGKENPIANYMVASGYSFNDFRLTLDADPATGLNGGGHLYTLNMGSITLDTLQMHIFQDSTGVKMDGRVRNGPDNRQFVFDSRINAYLHTIGAGIDMTYTDEKGETGIDIGLRADVLDKGLRIVFSQTHPIIAYRKFEINKDNYVFLGNDQRVEADIDMKAEDGTAAKIYSIPNPEALQDLSVNLHHFNLGELTSVIPYAPHITGLLETDAHLIQTTRDLSIVADLEVENMGYEGAPLGNITLSTVYLPNDDGTHFVDARVSQDDTEVLVLTGAYRENQGKGNIRADINMTDFPLALANGFIPDQMASLEGQANGRMTVNGSTQQPEINGWFSTQDMEITSSVYSLNLRMDNDTVKIRKNRLDLDRLHVYSTGTNPLVFDGTVDFSNFENILLDLSMNASNFELINAKRTQQASAYGKVYVSVNARMSGNLNNINIGGRLGLLGSTDVTYVLKDSPISSEDRLSGLVEFVDFRDTVFVKSEEKARPMNLNIMMQVNIDQGVQVHCLLSDDRSKYIDLEGGGELTLNYTPQGELTLNGRYTVLNGEMKYSLPVIPLKTFTIASGSYVDFNGPVLNPTLNISASERVRATVTENNSPRTVSFDVGLSITRTLSDMGLEFTISAPEDMTVQNQLASMSAEERGKVAVTMLATGMYLGDGSEGSGFSTSNALNALLQNEINNIAGKALETIDLSLGVDQGTTAEGTSRTDYSFRFAKRFWGNRVSIIIGGKVSTGENVENTGQSLIDNISLEYRLDKSATRYVTLFYDKNYESLLEGEITEMGAGLVLRRKMTRLGELFIFRNRKKGNAQPVNERNNESDK